MYRENHDWNFQMEDMIGRRVLSISKSFDAIHLELENHTCVFEHIQDCCENVTLEDSEYYEEDFQDAVIHDVEWATKHDPDAGEEGMWSFLKIRTSKGYAWFRWYGSSNGWYSVEVHFRAYKK